MEQGDEDRRHGDTEKTWRQQGLENSRCDAGTGRARKQRNGCPKKRARAAAAYNAQLGVWDSRADSTKSATSWTMLVIPFSTLFLDLVHKLLRLVGPQLGVNLASPNSERLQHLVHSRF